MRSRFRETVLFGIGFSSGPRLQPLPPRHRSRGMRFACVKACTKIDDARMSSTYTSSMISGGRLFYALILQMDTQKMIAELDPLCRAILVLRIAIRSSIQDCSLRLNVPRAAVLAANCHAMTWLDQCHVKPLEDDHQRFACPLETLPFDFCAPRLLGLKAPLGLRIGGSHDDRTR